MASNSEIEQMEEIMRTFQEGARVRVNGKDSKGNFINNRDGEIIKVVPNSNNKIWRVCLFGEKEDRFFEGSSLTQNDIIWNDCDFDSEDEYNLDNFLQDDEDDDHEDTKTNKNDAIAGLINLKTAILDFVKQKNMRSEWDAFYANFVGASSALVVAPVVVSSVTPVVVSSVTPVVVSSVTPVVVSSVTPVVVSSDSTAEYACWADAPVDRL